LSTIKLVTTEDGSHSLYNNDIKEGYHSFHGALQESKHVFIEAGLESFFNKNSSNRIKVLEIGLGTGLNALLVAEWAFNNKTQVSMTSFETLPVEEDIVEKLNYPSLINSDQAEVWFNRIHSTSWEQSHDINENFRLEKVQEEIQKAEIKGSYSVVFFDAFAPNKQSEMWEIAVLEKVTGSLDKDGIFVTYCAKGQLKRDLKSLGLVVETLPGPPGKKEMTRAIKST